MINYKYQRDEFDSLDILCCRHRRFPYHWIGHTAQVYRDMATGQLQVFESTSMNKFSGSGKNGVQLNPLGQWLYEYDGIVRVKRLEFRLPDGTYDRHLPFHTRCKFEKYIAKYRGTSYPDLKTHKDRWFLINAVIDLHIWPLSLLFKNKPNDDVIFCSHNVAKSMQFCGLQGREEVPPEYTPFDFENGTDENLQLIRCRILPIDLPNGTRIK